MGVARGPGQRAGLTRAAVLAAARAVLDDTGVESLTMRAVARRLGVAPNALYSHVEGRTALLDALLDELLAEIPAPDLDTAEPVAGLIELMSSTYTHLTAHADLVPAYLARQGARGPHAVRLGHIADALLTRAGVSADDVAEARRVLIIHAIGSAAFVTAAADGHDAAPPMSAEDLQRTFARSLRWLLAGVMDAVSSPGETRQGGASATLGGGQVLLDEREDLAPGGR